MRINIRSSHRDYFRKYLFFSSRSTFFCIFQEALCVHRTDAYFPGRFVCSPNRYKISRSPLYVFIEQIPFPGALFQLPNRYQFSRNTFLATEKIPSFQEHFFFGYRTDTDFPETLFQLPNRYRFSRNTFLATEQIPIFQEHFFSYRTDNDFPGSLFWISTQASVAAFETCNNTVQKRERMQTS